MAVLLTGLAVLIGTAAAGEERRRAEAAILKAYPDHEGIGFLTTAVNLWFAFCAGG